MAEKIDVQVTGKSEAEIAHQMAVDILFTVEKRNGIKSRGLST